MFVAENLLTSEMQMPVVWMMVLSEHSTTAYSKLVFAYDKQNRFVFLQLVSDSGQTIEICM